MPYASCYGALGRRLGCTRRLRRAASGRAGGGGGSGAAAGDGSGRTAWGRAAVRVQDSAAATTTTTPRTDDRYVREIRANVDYSPAMHLKTLEEELQAAVGQALGRQGRKVQAAVDRVLAERERYRRLREQLDGDDGRTAESHPELAACAARFRELRQQALTARWELLVHRQAAGFTVDNHAVVTAAFPVPATLTGPDDPDGDTELRRQRQLGHQLDWWQRVGRWR